MPVKSLGDELSWRRTRCVWLFSPDYLLVTAIEGRALRSEGNGPVSWSGLQTEFVEQTPGKMRSPSQAPKAALKLFVSVPSLLQAHPSIDRMSYFASGHERCGPAGC